MSHASTQDPRAGFTAVESLIAMVMISAVLMLLGPSLFHVARERVTVDAAMSREAVLRGESNRLASLSFDDLSAEVGCTTVTDSELPHTRCVTVTDLSEQERLVKIAVTPTNALIPQDSIVMTRTDREFNPFHTTAP